MQKVTISFTHYTSPIVLFYQQIEDTDKMRTNGDVIEVIDVLVANYDYIPSKSNHDNASVVKLHLSKNDILYVMAKSRNGWFDGLLYSNKEMMGGGCNLQRGWFPGNYTSTITDRRERNFLLNRLYSIFGGNPVDEPSREYTCGSSSSSLSLLSLSKNDENKSIQAFNDYNDEVNLQTMRNSQTDLITENNRTIRRDQILKNDEVIKRLNEYNEENLFWTPILVNNEENLIYHQKELDIFTYALPTLNRYNNKRNLKSSTSENNHLFSPVGNFTTQFNKDQLFYRHENDIKYWSELFESTIYFTKLSYNAFHNKDRYKFDQHFLLTSTCISYIQLSCRLLKSKFNSKDKKTIKTFLKSIVDSLSSIHLNLNLYLDKESYLKTNNQSMRSNTSITERNDSVITSSTMNNSIGSSLGTAKMEGHRGTFKDLSPDADFNFADYFSSLYDSIEIEFFHLYKSVESIYFHLQSIMEDESDSFLPQIFPRFYQDSFNGGSWHNPFNDKSVAKPISGSNSVLLRETNSRSEQSISKEGSTTLIGGRSMTNTTYASNERFKRPSLNRMSSILTPTMSSSIRQTESVENMQLSKKKLYPLNQDTLRQMEKRTDEVYEKVIKDIYLDEKQEKGINNKNFDRNMKTYEELNERFLSIDIIENLDLSFFVNLRNVITKNSHDSEINDGGLNFIHHSGSRISNLLNQFFDLKQEFHNTLIGLTMCTQVTTLDDPYVFNSMRNSKPVGYFENILKTDLTSKNTRIEGRGNDYQKKLFKSLTKKDAENNGISFLNATEKFQESYLKYHKMNILSSSIVKKLIDEKENIINYCSRMMMNSLITCLLKDEYKESKWYESCLINADSDISYINEDSTNNVNQTIKYLKNESSKSLLYSNDGNIIMKGTREALVDYLIFSDSNGRIDKRFMKTFLITIKSIFPNLTEFVITLTKKFNGIAPVGLSFNEYNDWIQRKLIPTKKNIIEILRLFFLRYWTNSYLEPNLESVILSLLKLAETEEIEGAKELYTSTEAMFKFCIAFEDLSLEKKPNFNSRSNNMYLTSSGLLTKSRSRRILQDLTSTEFAEQLTLMNHGLLSHVTIFECLHRVWGNQNGCNFGGSAYISSFIAHANQLTNFISNEIVTEIDLKKRVKLIKYFIAAAAHCETMNNYATVTAIISALSSSPIYRLKKTWLQVPKESKATLRKLDKLMDSKKNFINYRNRIKNLPKSTACVPFFGVYLSDLTFTNAGNVDCLPFLNFNKRQKLTDIILEIMTFRNNSYGGAATRDDQVCDYIYECLENAPELEAQYELSLQIEPRTADASKSIKPITRENEMELNKPPRFWKKKQKLRLFG